MGGLSAFVLDPSSMDLKRMPVRDIACSVPLPRRDDNGFSRATLTWTKKEIEERPMQIESKLRCLNCGHQRVEQMPQDACQFFYDCTGCGTRLKPKAGDCCVFCSYGSVPCPPIQAQQAGEPGAGPCCT